MKHEPIAAARACPLCGAGADQAEPFLSDTRDESRVNQSSFASRKIPEYMSHAMVRCRVCDLAYVDRPPSVASLAASYHEADYDSAEEAEDAADAYAWPLRTVLDLLKGRDRALEIGTGTGAFLERLKSEGFTQLIGIEPSSAAIAAAPSHRLPWIREGIFEEANFPPESFDLICCFMTLEHVQDPGALVAAAHRLLKPGGVFVGVTHDRRAWLNRLLGHRSPIVDIEHMQLFSAASARELLRHHGYNAVDGTSFRNSYRPSYWLRLVPMPDSLKRTLTRWLRKSWLDRQRLSINVGNYMSWGFKPL
ncbi:MAG: class I SAM-dependent methyltransferase [Sphingopyxis sp.]|nr:class I SAM-dependent methyltransferase [Sphingopyxis sp.]